jgi:DNA mismatch repair ATPase MutL
MLNKNSVNFNASVYKSKLISKVKPDHRQIRKVNKDKLLTKEQFKNFKFIGQFDKKFIIAYNSKNKDIIIFDQHAIHERILYEFYTDLLKSELTLSNLEITSSISKLNLFSEILGKHYLKEPIIVKINIESLNQTLDIKQLNSLFNFDFIGLSEKAVKLFTVPVFYDKILDKDSYMEMFVNLAENISVIFDEEYRIKNVGFLLDIFIHVIKMRACKDAIKFNEELDEEFLNDLMMNLKLCLNPFLCAHGRHNFFILYKSE